MYLLWWGVVWGSQAHAVAALLHSGVVSSTEQRTSDVIDEIISSEPRQRGIGGAI